MPMSPRLPQSPDQIVSLAGWELDDDFPYGPQGAKPKRILFCPNPPPHGFLIGGHRYLFKEPPAARAQQIWSEVIGYELSRDLGLPVPPAFLAHGAGNGAPGVLIEFFYGYTMDTDARFVHAIELLQGLKLQIDSRRGSLKDNITLCRIFDPQGWRPWWARTLVFDAIIGNTDRHTENWGFLTLPASTPRQYALAPAFDNGTSLGHIIRESELAKYTSTSELRRLIERGTHHYGWVAGDHAGAQHARLVRTYQDRYGLGGAMEDGLNLKDDRIDRLVAWCCSFDFALPFTEARASFVAAQLRGRRDVLAAALGA